MPSLGNTPRPAYVYDTETDTWVPIGVGAHTHDDLYINQTVIDAKGDLLVGTADNSYARLARGADGTVLVADNTTQTGLAWQPYGAIQVAGKNRIINGDFSIWQRGTSFSSPGTGTYTADRWNTDASSSITRQVGPAGFGYCLRSSNTSLNPAIRQGVELIAAGNAGQFSLGSTWTISYFARTSTPISANQAIYIAFANFATAGSPAVEVVSATNIGASSTSWTRYSHTFTINVSPSGSNTCLQVVPYLFSGAYAGNWEITGVQLEPGPIATPFTTHTGSIQGELAACRRYYFRFPAVGSYTGFALGFSYSTNLSYYHFPLIPEMRTAPTSIEFSGLGAHLPGQYIDAVTALSISTNERSSNAIMLTATTTSNNLIVNRPYFLAANNNTNAFIGISAEL